MLRRRQLTPTRRSAMAAPYPIEYRRAAAAAYDECLSSDEAAATMGCCGSWLRRLIQRRDAHPDPTSDDALAPLPAKRPVNDKLGEADLEQLRTLIAKKPDMTLAELAAALGTKVG